MLHKKLIICDLDGTLLNDEKEITKKTVNTLQKASASNCKICLASGRGEQMMSIYSDVLGVVSYLLSNNGAMVRCLDNQEIIYQEAMEQDTVMKLLKFLHDRKFPYMIYNENSIGIYESDNKLVERIISYEKKAFNMGLKAHIKTVFMNDEWESKIKKISKVLKIVVYEKNRQRMNEFISFLNFNFSNITYESTGYGLMGCFAANVSKKTGILRIMDDCRITPSYTFVFGDYDNDLSMFSCADNRIAMANASLKVKKQASYITESNNNDGVANYIEKYIL